MNLKTQLGFQSEAENPPIHDPRVLQYINLKLAAMGCPIYEGSGQRELHELARPLLANHQEKERLLAHHLCPVDQRIDSFLKSYLGPDVPCPGPLIPARTFVLDHHGLSRVLSLPPDRDEFISDIVSSYRIQQGVLHNPQSDRRTTAGVFHVAEGGLPIPADKKRVPRNAFARLLHHALNPPHSLLQLPFTSNQREQAETFVSLLLRPVVCPEVPGVTSEKTLEIRFFAPGNLVSNLDFVESIFGNAGDPYLPENDSGLDVRNWSGHTGCVILAPHLIHLTKKELGLPHWDEATERQQKDGMAWRDEQEHYNDGSAFKVTCRDERGVMVTLIADNYFGYCKKEVKTQISYAANLMGNCEEEHAGGALAFPSYDLGEEFSLHTRIPRYNHTFAEVLERFSDLMHVQPEVYGIDKHYPDILYIPEQARFNLQQLSVTWIHNGEEQRIKLLPGRNYIRPSGYNVHMEKPPGGRAWRLIGTVAEGTFCHKPSTVSGGGKSEISKPITDAIIQGPVVIAHIKEDMDRVEEILNRDYEDRYKPAFKKNRPARAILSPDRSVGSVIKLLTPSKTEYTDEYNEWLRSIPNYIKELVYVIKRFYKPGWGANWRDHFQVDFVNGQPGNELKCDGRKLVGNYIRVGYEKDGSWRVFGLRKDFQPSVKLQMEDDISASTVIQARRLQYLNPDYRNECVKLVKNCEYRLFQRPDEAIHRGYDKQTEADFTKPDNFLSNYEPLTREDAREMIDDAIAFEKFTPPMQALIRKAAETTRPKYFVCTALPRLVDGQRSKNPRYLQDRPDLVHPRAGYLAEVAIRFFRKIPLDQPVHLPVNAVLPGRRNNPPDPVTGIRPLAVFNPIHYQELPELFMELISSMTGKSPSTTGAGSEGALTKGPFNALLPITDLNNAVVSYVLTGDECFTTAGGYIGPNARIDHDISLLVPEIWCRMTVEERDPKYLIRHGYLEKVMDFEFGGKVVPASRLGYRITSRFVASFFGRVFNNPDVVFTEEMLRPETQDLAVFADGIDNMVSTARRVANLYFEDGSIELACPPLMALLHLMAHGHYDGKSITHPEIRGLFTRDYVLGSDWYRRRLQKQQQLDLALWQRHAQYLEVFLQRQSHTSEAERLGLRERLANVRQQIETVGQKDYIDQLAGLLGADDVKLNCSGT